MLVVGEKNGDGTIAAVAVVHASFPSLLVVLLQSSLAIKSGEST